VLPPLWPALVPEARAVDGLGVASRPLASPPPGPAGPGAPSGLVSGESDAFRLSGGASLAS
jgi:hypothetical protein